MQPQPYNPSGLPPVGTYQPSQGSPQPSQPDRQPNTQPKKGSFLTKVAFIAPIITLIAGIGIGYMLPRSSQSLPTEPTTESKKTNDTSAPNPAVINALTELSGQINGGVIEQTRLAPHYQIPGDAYPTASSQAMSRNIGVEKTKDQVGATTNVIATYFKNNGYQEAIIADDPSNYYARYSDDTLMCGLRRSVASVASLTSIQVACAAKADYKANVSVQKPFYEAYTVAKTANPSATFPALLGMPVVTDSRTDGYKTAELTAQDETGGVSTLALFYQTPDKAWHFTANTSQRLTCSAFKTPDMQKAYLGEVCFNETLKRDDTVKL